ncbi:MAG: peroxiredoxin [Alphaproteobacteria bacterium]
MTIKVGDRVPSATLHRMASDGPAKVTTDEIFAGRRVAMFGLPGAFTPTCSGQHCPGFVEHADALAAKGIDMIACVAVNDAFVMDAWGRDQKVGDKVVMLADGNGEFTRKLGLEADFQAFGMGLRSKRFSMIVEDGVVKTLNIEAGGGLKVSDAGSLLKQA